MGDSLKGLFGGGEAAESPPKPDAKPRRRREGREGREKRAGREGREPRQRGRDRPRREQEQDFVDRYLSGNPSEGYSTEEAVENLRRVRQEVPPDVLRRATARSIEQLPPDQRAAFAEMLQKRQAGQGMVQIERTGGGAGAPGGDPLADLFGGLLGGAVGGATAPSGGGQTSGGGGLDDLLGGLLGGVMGAPGPATGGPAPGGAGIDDLLGGLLGGPPAAEPAPRQTSTEGGDAGSGIGDILGNPMTKAVLGGIAAFAMKEMIDQDQ